MGIGEIVDGPDATDVKPPRGEDWNPVEKVILERRSVRKYKDRQVPEKVVRRILEAGRFAPSAGNCQPWRFIVVRDEAIIEAMEKDMCRWARIFRFLLDWRTSPLGRRIPWLFCQILIRLMPNKLHPIPMGAIFLIAEGKLTGFHGAPTVILICKDKRGVSNPDIDVGACGQNMVLAAHSMGLGTCWVGMIELLKFTPKWSRRLGVEWPYDVVEGISLGYPVGNPDGMIPRETHGTVWFEAGDARTVY